MFRNLFFLNFDIFSLIKLHRREIGEKQISDSKQVIFNISSYE